MEFGIVVEASVGLENRTRLIHGLSRKLSEYFSNKDYGNDVKEILIGIISVAPEFEWFSKIRKPKYSFYRKYTSRDGIEIIEDKLFSFDLKIDYEAFKNQSDDQNKKMLAAEVLRSLSNLDSLPKKVKDFDKDQFKEDMKTFFSKDELI